MLRRRGGLPNFARNFAGGLLDCALEELELIPLAIPILFLCFLLFGAFMVVKELMFDPDCAQVSLRLAALSIDPSRWG